MGLSNRHRFIVGFASLVVVFVALKWLTPHAASEKYNWLQFDFDAQHSGNNTREALISPANVNRLHRLFQVKLQGTYLPVADGAPVYLSDVPTSTGIRSLLFVTTMAGDIIALDALTGEQLWSHANPAPGPCYVNGNGVPCYTTSSPAIDPNLQYVYSYGLDGYVHKYRVGDGTEIIGNGWPALTTTKGINEKGSSALSVATDRAGNSYLYVAHSGYPGDGGDYQGHLTVINLATGVQHVFNTLCADQSDVHFQLIGPTDCTTTQAAIWGRPGVVYDADMDRIYFATGNGNFDPSNFAWGDSVLALHPDGTGDRPGIPVDSFTPVDADTLQDDDLDLGSTSPAILPLVGSHHYAVQGGKDKVLRLIDLRDLSAQGAPGNLGGEIPESRFTLPQNDPILTQPAVWTNPADGNTWVLVATVDGMTGLLMNVGGDGWGTSWTTRNGCSSPIIANGVLFCAGGNQIKAFDPVTGEEKWSDDSIGTIHWQSPIVVNGVLYITDNSSQITAYALTMPTS